MKEKNKKITIFDIINNITQTNEDRWLEFESIYKPFIINRFLVMHHETAGYAELINRTNLNKKEQYYFYLYSIPNKKRYFQYTKKKIINYLPEVSRLYNISEEKAKIYVKILGNEKIKKILPNV